MIETIRHKAKIYIVLLFALLIGTVVFNDVANMHVHRLDNGQMVIHAHPFNKKQDSDPVKHHHHSTYDFVQIQAHSNIILSTTQHPDFTPPVIHTKVYLPNYTNAKPEYHFSLKNKAPPYITLQNEA